MASSQPPSDLPDCDRLRTKPTWSHFEVHSDGQTEIKKLLKTKRENDNAPAFFMGLVENA
jgi:hypothetical protein